MEKVLKISKVCLSSVLVLSTLFANFTLSFSREIRFFGCDKVDADTGAYTEYEIPGQGRTYYTVPSQEVVLYGIDSCVIMSRLPGCFNPSRYVKHADRHVEVTGFKVITFIASEHFRLSERKTKTHFDFKLRFMAVSAPYLVSSAGNNERHALDSRTPFSLQNAVRLGARSALDDEPIWGNSNWSDPELLSESVVLMNYHDEELPAFIQRLEEVQPHVLFIGCMTLSFPGAISLATIAKECFGDAVFIVLGGKHANEVVYQKHGVVQHHPSSPTTLMQQGRIPKVFDLIVSGDGEEVVQQIGESIGADILSGSYIQNFSAYKSSFSDLRGSFILSWIEDGEIQTQISKGLDLDRDNLPSPVSLFGVSTNFPVFGRKYTAHVYSDIGKGCVFNCSFCSEASTVSGKPSKNGDPTLRLYRQLADASAQDESMSAFDEDSILLMANPMYLAQLADLLEQHPLPIVFGGQFTMDNLLNPNVQEQILRLKNVGLMYIYVGMETANEVVAEHMSKNTGKAGWIERNEKAIAFLSANDIKLGVSVLWGLGESQYDRLYQLTLLQEWRTKHGNPVVISLNWATQHPLYNKSSFDYIDWGTDRESEYLPLFVEMFGEASERYVCQGGELPSMAELKELKAKFEIINNIV